MDPKKRIDKILTSVHDLVKEEVGVLLGVKIQLSDFRSTLTSKKDILGGLGGKQVVAKIDLSGEVEGVGCLVIGIKDAIRLGGTLIMLPDSELEEVVGREEYTDETEDSFGEIANIIAGSYTKVFEEMYPKSFRFIRKEQEILVPSQPEIESDKAFPDQEYYQVSCAVVMAEREMGDLHMLIPAEPFGLQSKDSVQEHEPLQQGVESSSVESEPVQQVVEGVDGSGESSEVKAPKRAIDPVKHKKRVDRLLATCEQKLTEEVSALLGAGVKFSSQENRLISKEEFFFEEVNGKQVMADMEVSGELESKSYFYIGLKDAIHLGGVLIMLPPAELETTISNEEYSEDIADSYGEVANIVSGVYTSVFEEQYIEKVRFVKKDIHHVVPMKVDIESDEPMPDQQYYMSSMTLHIEGEELGKARMMFPAEMLHLLQEHDREEGESARAAQSVPGAAEPVGGKTEPEDPSASVPAKGPRFDPAKHKKRVDKLLKECRKTMKEEVGALLGTEIKLDEMENRLISKEDFFFDVASGKQVLAYMNAVGDVEDKSYLFVSLKDAIHLGGLLIMLPPSELDAAVSDEEFSEDTRDAYSEIANIIAGVYTGAFEERYTKKIRFIKTDIEQVVPMKVEIESDEPVPDQEYYLSSMSLTIEGNRQGKINMLFPAAMLQLDTSSMQAAEEAEEEAALHAASAESADSPTVPADILIISDDDATAASLTHVAADKGFTVRTVAFKDNVKGAITSDIKAVYIVAREFNEQAFGMAIKVSSSCSLPVIAAGPAWTRSKVIKAVKYGVNDILLTPATAEDISENLDNNLVSMAA